MKQRLLFSFFSLFLLSITSLKSQITISIPTIQQEATSVWRTINDIAFFEKTGYTINLPDHPMIDTLIVKSKKGTFGSEDFARIYQLLEEGVYSKKDYKKARKKVKSQLKLIRQALDTLSANKNNWNWDFKLFDTYEVVFTLYGSGGSYNSDNGQITLYTTPKGQFKSYKKPANTIIHEIVHIGIEESIIQHHQVNHAMKERIVDLMVKRLFGEWLPEYKLQDMGDYRMDEYLKRKNDVRSLNESVEKVLK